MWLQIEDRSRYANGPCKEEWRHVLSSFADIAVKVMEDVCEKEHGGDPKWLHENQPIFSFDNSRAHNGWEQVIDINNRAPLPAHSPDIHKVIEHSYAFFANKFKGNVSIDFARRWRLKLVEDMEWVALVKGLYYQYPLEAVRADVDSLPLTYSWIEQNGGKRAPKGLN